MSSGRGDSGVFFSALLFDMLIQEKQRYPRVLASDCRVVADLTKTDIQHEFQRSLKPEFVTR